MMFGTKKFTHTGVRILGYVGRGAATQRWNRAVFIPSTGRLGKH